MGVCVPAAGVSVGAQVSVRGLYQQLKGDCGLRGSFVQVPETQKIWIQGQPVGRLSASAQLWEGSPLCMCTCLSRYWTFLVISCSGKQDETMGGIWGSVSAECMCVTYICLICVSRCVCMYICSIGLCLNTCLLQILAWLRDSLDLGQGVAAASPLPGWDSVNP